jgi:hypothetical protein
MTKLIGPLNSDEARGRLGDLVYGTSRGVRYARAHVDPVQPNSAAQLACRGITRDATALWKTLGQEYRDGWNLYAKTVENPDWTGKPRRPSGYNCFIAACHVRAKYDFDLPTTAPTQDKPPQLRSAEVAYSAPNAVVTWTLTDASRSVFQYCEVFWVPDVPIQNRPDIRQKVLHAHAPANDLTLSFPISVPTAPALWLRLIDWTMGTVGPWLLIHTLLQAPTTGTAHGRVTIQGTPQNLWPVHCSATTVYTDPNGYWTMTDLPPGLSTFYPNNAGLIWTPDHFTGTVTAGTTLECGTFNGEPVP